MGKQLSSLFKTNEMNPGAKGVLLVVGSYVVTVGMAVTIIVLAIIILYGTAANCSTVSRSIPVLWITIAAVFLASVVVVSVVSRKVIPSAAGRWAIVVAYGVMLLVSYVFIAFGLLVLFNC